MLVLSRHVDEGVMIGKDIEILVIAIQGDKVRLGFKAPRDVVIHRKEIWLQIHADDPVPAPAASA